MFYFHDKHFSLCCLLLLLFKMSTVSQFNIIFCVEPTEALLDINKEVLQFNLQVDKLSKKPRQKTMAKNSPQKMPRSWGRSRQVWGASSKRPWRSTRRRPGRSKTTIIIWKKPLQKSSKISKFINWKSCIFLLIVYFENMSFSHNNNKLEKKCQNHT